MSRSMFMAAAPAGALNLLLALKFPLGRQICVVKSKLTSTVTVGGAPPVKAWGGGACNGLLILSSSPSRVSTAPCCPGAYFLFGISSPVAAFRLPRRYLGS